GLPGDAVGVRVRHVLRARAAGRRQDHRCRRAGPGDRRLPRRQGGDPDLGVPAHRGRTGPGYLLGWLAHHPYPRPPGDPPAPAGGVRGRDDREYRTVRHRAARLADLDHAHDHLRDHGRRCRQAVLGRTLGRGRQHRARLDLHVPRRGGGRRAGTPADPAAVRMTPDEVFVLAARRFAESGATPAVPRVAATVVLLREPYEVYLMERAATMAFAAGMYAFPGGGAEPVDADPRATAVREVRAELARFDSIEAALAAPRDLSPVQPRVVDGKLVY